MTNFQIVYLKFSRHKLRQLARSDRTKGTWDGLVKDGRWKMEGGGSESSSDESLDIKSERFDPLKALYSVKLHLPISNAKVYDNLSKYEAVSKGLSSKIFESSRKENAELHNTEKRRFLPHQEPIPSGSRSSWFKDNKHGKKELKSYGDKNVLTRMKGTLGPLEMLLRCMEQKTRVKVYTRGARNIRGYVLAYVVAFDKHWNLALEDCLEVWTRKVKRKAPALGIPNDEGSEYDTVERIKILVKESDGKIETVERHVPQMMMRGEQIAIIVKID